MLNRCGRRWNMEETASKGKVLTQIEDLSLGTVLHAQGDGCKRPEKISVADATRIAPFRASRRLAKRVSCVYRIASYNAGLRSRAQNWRHSASRSLAVGLGK